MKFPIKKFCLIFILITLLLMSCSLTIGAQTAVNDDDAFFESYTYWNDITGVNSKTAVYMQPIYRASNVLSVSNIVGEEINTLSDIYSDKNGYTYLLDSEASAIFILDSDYRLVNKINSLPTETTFCLTEREVFMLLPMERFTCAELKTPVYGY